jgi:hypothetical protein
MHACLPIADCIWLPSQSDLPTPPQNANIAAAFEIDVHRLLNMIDLTETINGATKYAADVCLWFRVLLYSILLYSR